MELWLSLDYDADNSILFINVKRIIKFKAEKKNVYFQLNLFSEVNVISLVLLSLEKYLEMEMCMICQSTAILLLNLKYRIFLNLL